MMTTRILINTINTLNLTSKYSAELDVMKLTPTQLIELEALVAKEKTHRAKVNKEYTEMINNFTNKE